MRHRPVCEVAAATTRHIPTESAVSREARKSSTCMPAMLSESL
nr:MAG TPA: hypothetical protein [Caudoviricetes sp.]